MFAAVGLFTILVNIVSIIDSSQDLFTFGNTSDDLLVIRYALGLYRKCKSIPVQAWTDPEGSRRLRFPDFNTVGT